MAAAMLTTLLLTLATAQISAQAASTAKEPTLAGLGAVVDPAARDALATLFWRLDSIEAEAAATREQLRATEARLNAALEAELRARQAADKALNASCACDDNLEGDVASVSNRNNGTIIINTTNNTHRQLQKEPPRNNTDGKYVRKHFAQVCIGWRSTLHHMKHRINCHHNEDNSDHDGHRRRSLQAIQPCGDLEARASAVSRECCDEKDEICHDGKPRTCNLGCATVFLAFRAECKESLGVNSAIYQSVVAKCQQTQEDNAPSGDMAHQLQLTCAGGNAIGGCIPSCDATMHGDLLIMNANGNDNKFR